MFVQLFIHGIANGQTGVVVGEKNERANCLTMRERGEKKKKKKKREEKKQREQDPKFSDVVESFERGNVIETLILPVYRFLSSQFLAKIARDTLQLISHLTFTRRI